MKRKLIIENHEEDKHQKITTNLLEQAIYSSQKELNSKLRQTVAQPFWECNYDEVKALLKQGADCNAQGTMGKTAVHWAAHHNNFPVLKKLADILNPLIKDENGYTPLYHILNISYQPPIKKGNEFYDYMITNYMKNKIKNLKLLLTKTEEALKKDYPWIIGEKINYLKEFFNEKGPLFPDYTNVGGYTSNMNIRTTALIDNLEKYHHKIHDNVKDSFSIEKYINLIKISKLFFYCGIELNSKLFSLIYNKPFAGALIQARLDLTSNNKLIKEVYKYAVLANLENNNEDKEALRYLDMSDPIINNKLATLDGEVLQTTNPSLSNCSYHILKSKKDIIIKELYKYKDINFSGIENFSFIQVKIFIEEISNGIYKNNDILKERLKELLTIKFYEEHPKYQIAGAYSNEIMTILNKSKIDSINLSKDAISILKSFIKEVSETYEKELGFSSGLIYKITSTFNKHAGEINVSEKVNLLTIIDGEAGIVEDNSSDDETTTIAGLGQSEVYEDWAA